MGGWLETSTIIEERGHFDSPQRIIRDGQQVEDTIMDLGGWLRSLGLEQYKAAFRENAIDQTILPSLKAEDLKDLGVKLVGHRRKLLDAIAALRKDTGAKAAPLDAPLTIDKSPKGTAERRQVTVMFSDLVGSTALSARMDPEDMREVISTYQKCVAEIVGRFDGFVAKYLGDGVLAYFGYPQAHEHDAERAVRAGLELIAAVSALRTHASLQTRIGIATGLVVVGDLIGSGEAQERGIVGETPNLAARLQGTAEPDTVVIAEGTRRLVGDLFELQDLGPMELEGIAGKMPAWVALRSSSVESRFEAMNANCLIPLVGREEEFDLLLRRWSKARSGEGLVVLLSGEAGIGKSRLTAALLDRLATELHARLRYFCRPLHTDTAFYPIVAQIERAAGLTYDDTPKARLDKLDALLAETSTSIEDAALFAEMMSISNDGRYLTLELVPQHRRQRTLEALNLQLNALTRSRPVLMVFEDAHWADPTSLELLSRIIKSIRNMPVLLIVTFRPEFAPPWVGQSHVTNLTLNRLDEREVTGIIERLVGSTQLPADGIAEIVERTNGIPLFVEEMTKAVLETETEGEARRAVAAIPSPSVALPPTLHASLMARLDRLGPAKAVAQIGAAIGRELSHALLALVARDTQVDLGAALDRLVQAGLLFRKGVPPYATYLFNHALVQDAAYSTLLREQVLALAEREGSTVPLLVGHRLMATSLLITGDIPEGRAHFDQAIALYDPAEHRPLATQFGQDIGVNIFSLRSWALWSLGYPEAALAETKQAVKNAREIGQTATLMYALVHAFWPNLWSGNYAAASSLLEEGAPLAAAKGASFWKALIMIFRGCLLATTREPSNATQAITSGIAAW